MFTFETFHEIITNTTLTLSDNNMLQKCLAILGVNGRSI